jgi:starch synthase
MRNTNLKLQKQILRVILLADEAFFPYISLIVFLFFIPLILYGMSKPLNVLFVTSEVEPFAKTGGLADVSAALPQTIKELGHEIRIILPRYGCISERRSKLHNVLRLKDIPIPIGKAEATANIKSSTIDSKKSKVQVYFIENQEYFGHQDLYVDSATKKDFPNNDERFIFFCRAVLETLKRLGWQPDIIHLNDWQSGLIPAYLHTLYKDDPFYKGIQSVFTIHNLAFQGIFPAASFQKTGLPKELFTTEGIEFFHKMSCLKAGLMYSNAITTVSERYAHEIQTSPEYGCGLEGVLHKRKNDLSGIINGIDYNLWNPETDDLIPVRYSIKDIELKSENKRYLLHTHNMEYHPEIPLIGMISRLTDQKGFDLLSEIFDDMMKLNVQFILLGTGEKKYHDLYEKLQKKYAGRVGMDLKFDNTLAHMIEAGADMFLMPSRYEPCGLNQLYSLRYGTVPIVRSTGGLDDTIDDIDASPKGTGFKFQKYDGKELLKSIQHAVKLYAEKGAWQKIQRNGMSKDFSWESSAKQYITLYRKLLRQ